MRPRARLCRGSRGVRSAISRLDDRPGAAGAQAIWHDPQTLAAIQGSGGLAEVFSLPITMVIPGACLGTVGGMLGGGARRAVRYIA
jgi:hypothetical protein